MKKGQGEQFNWIFIIIAGAIILAFFTMFAFKYIDLQERKQDVQSIKDLGAVLSTLEKLQVGDQYFALNSNEDSGLKFGYGLELSHNCIEDDSELYINDGEFANYELKDEILFTDSKQKINSLDLLIMPWRYPFHITNFIYLSDPNKNYNLIYDSSSRNFVNELDFSDIFNLEITDKVKIKDNSKYVFFTSRIPSENEIQNYLGTSDSTEFVYVDTRTKKISFFDNGWSEPVNYYGEEMMIGSVFSNSKENYECNVNKAISKLKGTSNIYLERIKLLNQINKNC